MIETLSKPAIEGNCLKASIKTNKTKNPATSIILNNKRLMTGSISRLFVLTYTFQHLYTGDPS